MVAGPTRDQAHQLALMLAAGLPSPEALRYFFASEADAIASHDAWMTSRALAAAVKAVQGKDWTDMTLDERIQTAIDKHYNELAYFLYSRNYSQLNGAERAKADTCRVALETKLAGMAGKLDALSRFWDDVRTGRIIMPAPKPLDEKVN